MNSWTFKIYFGFRNSDFKWPDEAFTSFAIHYSSFPATKRDFALLNMIIIDHILHMLLKRSVPLKADTRPFLLFKALPYGTMEADHFQRSNG